MRSSDDMALADSAGNYDGLEAAGAGDRPGWTRGTTGGHVSSDSRQRSIRSSTPRSSTSRTSDTSHDGPTYGPLGSYSGSLDEGATLASGGFSVDPASDPDIIRIGNPGPNAPVIDFGSPHLGGTMVEEAEAEYVRRVEELDFELAEESSSSRRGWVDMRQVETVLHSVTPAAMMCYSRVRERNPDLSGTLVLILTLSTGGQISAVSMDVTSSTLVDTDLKRCVERQIKSRNYPIPDGGPVTFSYPFRFSP